jgi:uncharacterized protein
LDFVPLIDALGEEGAVLAVGAMLGLAFGIFAQLSAFCTRSAVIEMVRGRKGDALPVWLAGFATALLAVQAMIASGHLLVSETRFLATPQSLSGALIGGLVFGVGMVLARGCVSRLMVLAGTGNLRAVFSLAVAALVAWAALFGPLTVVRDWIAPLATTAALGGNELLLFTGGGHIVGVLAGALLLALALWLTLARETSLWRTAGGAAVGLVVAAGWLATYSLSAQLFDPVAVESLSLVRPLAMTVVSIADRAIAPGIDVALFAGIVAGAFLSAIVSRSFRVQTFSEPGTPSALRYGLGAAMMGIGGVLAAGCTVGAGLSGGSILAISALIALASMMAGAAITDRLIDRDRPA